MLKMEEEASTFKVLSIALLTTLSILTILAGATCFCIIHQTKELSKTPSSYLIRNLLTVHFIQSVIVFPLYVAKKHGVESLLWNTIICDGFRFTFMITFYIAIFSVSLIAIDRRIAVFHPIRYREMVTKRRVLFCIIGIWVYITLLCLIPFKYNGNHGTISFVYKINNTISNATIPRNATLLNKNHVSKCDYNQPPLWTILMLGINCLLPYVSIVVIYRSITHKMKKIHARTNIRRESAGYYADKCIKKNKKKSAGSTAKEMSMKRKITKVSMLLSIAYLITWSPSVLYYILWCVCPHTCFTDAYQYSKEETYITFAMKYLAFLDAIVSPVIYCFFSERFRYFVPCLKGEKTKRVHLAHVKPITKKTLKQINVKTL